MTTTLHGWRIRVRGLVQGVGFRPTVWRLAREEGLQGQVLNDARGVLIRVWGDGAALARFRDKLVVQCPPLARIDAVDCRPLEEPPPDSGEFRIIASRAGEVHTGIVPDSATCLQCGREIFDPADRRYRYPFTNCTHCGPRLSIVRGLPYDRANTSMAAFPLCPACRAEYDNPSDRRFHAQPNACPVCGPRLWLEGADGGRMETGPEDALTVAGRLLASGRILAIKGLGGFHLACDAGNEAAVRALRERKRRPHKPLALMARDVATIRRFCPVPELERELLESVAAPIVVLPLGGPERLAPGVAPGQSHLGFMLPHTPLHHLLLADRDRPLVMTSGNRSGEPPCLSNDQARERLSGIAHDFLLHDRDIVNRVDDSVLRVMDGRPRFLRRARGYAPAPLSLPPGFEGVPDLLALGGELKNTFCLLKDDQAVVSQHQGDLENAATDRDYRHHLDLYARLYQHRPRGLAVDAHPDYRSTRLGRQWAARDGLELREVGHHHAHIAACLGEQGVARDAGPVLGVVLDGLGYGENGGLWGGEFLLADYRRCRRLGGLKPVALLGGERAMGEPWRNTYAHLDAALGWSRCRREYGGLELVRYLESKPLATLDAMLRRGLNCPPASSCGRLFDAVAGALGICRDGISYEGQAAMELEAMVTRDGAAGQEDGVAYGFDRVWEGGLLRLNFRPLWTALLGDLARGAPAGVMAARFHRGLARAVVTTVRELNGEYRAPVVLSGGVFQNRILLEQVGGGLREAGFTVWAPERLPANDGGLALGQALVAGAVWLGGCGRSL